MFCYIILIINPYQLSTVLSHSQVLITILNYIDYIKKVSYS